MRQIKLLIVDDQDEIRQCIRSILLQNKTKFPYIHEDFRYEIAEASSGEKALREIDSNPPDIILLDHILPKMRGIDVLGYINEQGLNILTVFMTTHTYASVELAAQAAKYGAVDCISKPFTQEELLSTVETTTRQLFMMKMARNMNKEGKQIRFQFMSVLSHELKAPINAIEGYLQMFKTREFGNDISDYDHIVARTIHRIKGMRHLIMDLLDLTRVEVGAKKRELKKINLVDIANTSIDTLKPYAIQKDITINLNVDNNVYLTADATEMEIIFNNLISNAIKYNVDGGRVDISITARDYLISIIVSDTGIGMKEKDIAKLFNDFVRIKTPKTKNIKGSGLGLSIVRKIADMYDGKINVKSIPDKGSTFRVTLQNYEIK